MYGLEIHFIDGVKSQRTYSEGAKHQYRTKYQIERHDTTDFSGTTIVPLLYRLSPAMEVGDT
jgi:hypothetical protein